MKKEELIKLLKEYKENKAKLNIKLKELKSARINLKACDDIETNTTTTYGENQDIHSKNKISNKVLSKIEENEIKRLELQEEIEELENDKFVKCHENVVEMSYYNTKICSIITIVELSQLERNQLKALATNIYNSRKLAIEI